MCRKWRAVCLGCGTMLRSTSTQATLEDDLDPLSLSAVDDDRIGDGGEDDFDDVLRDFNVALPGEDD